MNLRARKLSIAVLATLGIGQLGAGFYIHAKAWLAQELIASAWSKTLAGDRDVRPWPWADTWPIARLRVSEAQVDVYVLADASGRSLAFGPGYVQGTATPGSDGHSMLAAHRDTHFKFLKDLKPGAILSLQTNDGRERRYRIRETHIIDVRFERLDVTGSEPTLTLLTCYPFDAIVPGGSLRYAATAELVDERSLITRSSATPFSLGEVGMRDSAVRGENAGVPENKRRRALCQASVSQASSRSNT